MSIIIILIFTELSYLLSIQQFPRFVRTGEDHLHKQQSSSIRVLMTERSEKLAHLAISPASAHSQ